MSTFTSLRGKRVLVVEDELLVALLIEDLLDELGCIVIGPVATVTAALAIVAETSIDIALLDVNLAGDKSYPVAELLADRGVPFSFLSGYGADALPPGRPEWRVCNKPFKTAELTGMLATLAG